MTVFLPDGNVLIALTVVDHIHHAAALDWFENGDVQLATCPITQGTLLRFLIREGQSTTVATNILETMASQVWHEFWPDAISYEYSQLKGVIGHRQVTDSYLVALAEHHGGRLVTFDKGLAAIHGERVELLEG